MTSTPDLTEPHAPDPPRDPADYGPRRRGLPFSFWLMIVFGLVCIFAGMAIGRFGSRWFPPKPAVESAAPAASNQTNESPLGIPGLTPAPAAPAPAQTAAATQPNSAQVAALSERIDRLAADQHRTETAAGAALAAAELSEAAQSSSPFADRLATLDRILPDSSALRVLRSLASQQTPSRAALAAEFADQADRIAVASRAPPQGSGLIARIVHALATVFTIRRVDKLTGDGPDAVLARAQRQIDDGDLEDALNTLNALPQTGRDALAGWRVRAVRRVQIDRLVAAIRETAAQDLADASGRGATP